LRSRLLLALNLALILLAFAQPALAWDNGGTNAADLSYGTHDWIAERAIDYLPSEEKTLILTYRAAYLYGTEVPDTVFQDAGCCHHVYFFANGTVQDDIAAVRAGWMQGNASAALRQGDYVRAANFTGVMTHYIADLASFGHVMGAETAWGAESQSRHGSYEDHVQRLTDAPAESVIPISFDGVLSSPSAYETALALARDTTFDLSGGGRNATWMNQHYNWTDPMFTARAYESINLAVNYVAEAVHAVWSSVTVTTTTTTQQETTVTTTQEQTTTQTQQTSLLTTATSVRTTVAAQGVGVGFAFVMIGIGAGVALGLAAFGIAARPPTVTFGPMNYCCYCGRRVPPRSRFCQFCRRALS